MSGRPLDGAVQTTAGATVLVPATAASDDVARARARQLATALNQAVQMTAPPRSPRNALELAVVFLLSHNASTRAAYARDLGDWLAWLEREGLEPLAVTRGTVDAYRLELLAAKDRGGRGYADATVARRLACLSGYYQYAVDEDLIARNPAARVTRPKQSADAQKLGLSREQARDLLAAAEASGDRDLLLVSLLLHNRLRISEALAARVEDLDADAGHRILRVRRKGTKAGRIPAQPDRASRA
jgi:integrase/recombinase XerD